MTLQHPQHYKGTANSATFKGCATICRLLNLQSLCNTCKILKDFSYKKALEHSHHFEGIATL